MTFRFKRGFILPRLLPSSLLFLFLMVLPCARVTSLDSNPVILDIEVWTEGEPIRLTDPETVRDTLRNTERNPAPAPAPEKREELLKEAQYILGGMIFGFSFTYIPLDRERNVAEYFTLTPIAGIPWGDSNLKIRAARMEGDRLVCKVSYELKDFQENWYSLWRSNDFPSAGALGTGGVFEGTSGRLKAMENGVKEAVREYARQRILNKPKKIEGEVVFSEPPRLYIDSGNYVARVRIRLNIKKVTGYLRY